MTTADLLDGKFNRVQIRKNEAGYHEVLVDGQKVERCTGVKVENVDPGGRLMNVTISFHCGSVEIDVGDVETAEDTGPPAGPPRPHLRGGT